MNFKISIALGLFLILSGGSTSFAQVKRCALDLIVTQYQKDETARAIPISGASATATNVETKEIEKSVLFEGMPRFSKLSEGSYNLSVTKDGYARTLKNVKIDCALGEDLVLSEKIFLWEGSPEQTMKMIDVSIALTSKDNAPVKSSEVENTKTKSQSPKTVSGGILNGAAKKIVLPEYPRAARASGARGAVNVQVTINERGKVVSAKAVSGHHSLREAAEKAARASEFAPTLLEGQPVRVTGVIVYVFN